MRRGILGLLLLLAGCGVPENAGFDDVQKRVGERLPQRIHWDRGTAEDDEAKKAVAGLFAQELTADSAVQIALLQNPDLQADYEDLGVAQADLVQAGLLRNPTFFASARFPSQPPGAANIEFAVVQEFLDLLMFPARKKIASAEFERARLHVADDVVDLAARTRQAWIAVVAAQQAAEIRGAIAAAAEATAEMSKRMRDAGNLDELSVLREQDQLESAKSAWSRADVEVAEARERLTGLLGAWGAETAWTAPSRLPELPAAEVPLEHIESLAIARRLDLAAALRDRDVSASRLDLVKAFRWIGAVDVGFSAERDSDRTWLTGPNLSIQLPIFDRQQAVIARLEAELRRRESLNRGLAIRIRSEVRSARARLVVARRLAEHQRTVVIPIRERIVALTQKEYNFMLKGISEVLQAKQREHDAYEESVRAVRDYWIARSELERAVGGKLPDADK